MVGGMMLTKAVKQHILEALSAARGDDLERANIAYDRSPEKRHEQMPGTGETLLQYVIRLEAEREINEEAVAFIESQGTTG